VLISPKIYLVRTLIHEILSWHISYNEVNCSTDKVMGEYH